MKKTYMTPATSQYKVELQQMIALSKTEEQASATAVALGKENEITEQPSGSHSIWDEEE